VRRILASVAIALVASSSATPAADAPVTAEGAHYRLVSSGPQSEADDWLKMLEAAWPQYVEFFGKAPPLAKDAKLAVAFFETLADMQAAIRAAGGSPPSGAGGYFDPISKTAYAWRQPSSWYTRTLVLHECAHQFHLLGRAAPKASMPAWYVEGLAEHVSGHTWDGERLRLRVVPMLSLENRAGEALAATTNGKFDLDAIFDAKSDDAERPEFMHVVRYLCDADGGKLRPKFDEIATKLDRGAKCDAKACASAFGPAKKLLASIRAWLPSVQEPWESLTVEWDARGAAALRAYSPSVVSLCRRRAETTRVAARVRPIAAAGEWRAGVLLRYAGPDDFDVGMIRGGKKCRVDRRKNGAWETMEEVDAPGEVDGWRVEAVRTGGRVAFLVNGASVADLDEPPGSMGLAADASTIDFTEIEAK